MKAPKSRPLIKEVRKNDRGEGKDHKVRRKEGGKGDKVKKRDHPTSIISARSPLACQSTETFWELEREREE